MWGTGLNNHTKPSCTGLESPACLFIFILKINKINFFNCFKVL